MNSLILSNPAAASCTAKVETSAVRGNAEVSETDLLILSDGTILAHNLTPEMALVLKELHEPAD